MENSKWSKEARNYLQIEGGLLVFRNLPGGEQNEEPIRIGDDANLFCHWVPKG